MPKRKRESAEDRYLRKIKRLEKKLKRKQRRSRSSSSDDSVCLPSRKTPTPIPPSPTSLLLPEHNDVEIVEVTGAEHIDNPEILDDSIIKALGNTVSTEKEYGPEVHTELVKRVEVIITQGLRKEIKDELMKKYMVPSNTKLLDAPKLNRELEGLLSDNMKARDKRVEDRQQQMGVAIAALLSATDNIIKNDVEKIKLITTVSDVTRLLMDLHNQDTITRKKLIIPNLDKNIGKTLEKQQRDEYLFGSNFNDSVKTATAIKKSANIILKQNNNNNNTRKPIPTKSSYPKKQGNFRAPPRTNMTQFKQGGGSRYHQQKQKHLQRPAAKPSVRQT